jgi:hypothetical protein
MMRYSMSQNVGRTPNVGHATRASAPAAEEGRPPGGTITTGTAPQPRLRPPEELNGTVISQCQPRHRHTSMTCQGHASQLTIERLSTKQNGALS